MSRMMIRLGIAVAVLIVMATTRRAEAGLITSMVNQSGHDGFLTPSAVLTATPYDFSGQSFSSLTTIDRLTVTLTIFDGDTDPGSFDEGQLVLLLDGIDTGLTLDGFPSDATITLTITDLSPINTASILSALQSDGQLIGSILDIDPTGLSANTIGLPATSTTTLTIEGAVAVPEPSTLTTGGLAGMMAILYAWRWRAGGRGSGATGSVFGTRAVGGPGTG